MSNKIRVLQNYIEFHYGTPQYMYLDLCNKRVKLVIYSDEYLEHIYNQIPYIVSENNDDVYDATIVLWKERQSEAPDVIMEIDEENQTYYYGLKSLEYDDVIFQGHILVHIFYKILKSETSSLVHGAVVGIKMRVCSYAQEAKGANLHWLF